jgi:hypothetical protein
MQINVFFMKDSSTSDITLVLAALGLGQSDAYMLEEKLKTSSHLGS